MQSPYSNFSPNFYFNQHSKPLPMNSLLIILSALSSVRRQGWNLVPESRYLEEETAWISRLMSPLFSSSIVLFPINMPEKDIFTWKFKTFNHDLEMTSAYYELLMCGTHSPRTRGCYGSQVNWAIYWFMILKGKQSLSEDWQQDIFGKIKEDSVKITNWLLKRRYWLARE